MQLTVCCVQGAPLRRGCCSTAGGSSLPGQGWTWLWRAGWVSWIQLLKFKISSLDLLYLYAGHIEPLVPHLTTSYSCTPCPPDQQPPYCVIKSFPHLPEHAAAWAKQKVTNLLHDKPQTCQQFLAEHRQSPDHLPGSQDCPPPGSVVSYKLLSMFGQTPTWVKCVLIALPGQSLTNISQQKLCSSSPTSVLTPQSALGSCSGPGQSCSPGLWYSV